MHLVHSMQPRVLVKNQDLSSVSASEDEASPLALLLLCAADDLPVGDHVERDGELLEDGDHVPVVLRAALHVRRAPRLLHLMIKEMESLYMFTCWARIIKKLLFCFKIELN